MEKEFRVFEDRNILFVGNEEDTVAFCDEYFQSSKYNDGLYLYKIEDEDGNEYMIDQDEKLVRA
jgi:hypothetical protein